MLEISASNLVAALLHELHLPIPNSLTDHDRKVVCVTPLRLDDGEVGAIRVTAEVKPNAARLMVERLPQVPSDLRHLYPKMRVVRVVHHQIAGTLIVKKELRQRCASSDIFRRFQLDLPAGKIDDLVERMVRGVIYAADHLGQDDPRLSWTSSVFSSLKSRPGSAVVLASFIGFLFVSGLLMANVNRT